MQNLLNYHTSSQPLADQMLALIRRPDDPALDDLYRRALIAIGRLESAGWIPLAFEDALATAPGQFGFDHVGHLVYLPSGQEAGEVYEAVSAAIERYLQLIAPSEHSQYLTIKEAASYLNIPEDTVKHHLYRTHRLDIHHKVGKTAMIDRAQLDAFKDEGIPTPGRPASLP